MKISGSKRENAFNPRTLGGATCPARAKMGNVNFSHFLIFGVKNKMSFFEAKYVIWKHLDSSVLKISQKSRPKPPVGGKQVRPTPFLLKNEGGPGQPCPDAQPSQATRAGLGWASGHGWPGQKWEMSIFTFSDFWGQKLNVFF